MLNMQSILESKPTMANLFSHPLAKPSWELEHAAPMRLHTRSLWSSPAEHEDDAPAERIIHQRAIFTNKPAIFNQLSVAQTAGYHKCASGQETDAALDVVVFTAEGDALWREVGRLRSTSEEVFRSGASLDLGGLEATSLVAQVRRAATDGWWPGWNLASTGMTLEGHANNEWEPDIEGSLHVAALDLNRQSDGVSARATATEVRFTSNHLQVGFRLTSPAWSHLALDADGRGNTHINLLQMPRSMDIVRSGVYPSGVYPVLRDQNAEYLAQGPRFTANHGLMPLGFLHSDYVGTTTVSGSTVRYEFISEAASQQYVLEFAVEADRIKIHVERTSDVERRAWTSSAWHIATNNRVTPSCALGPLSYRGETGLLSGAVAWHFPRHGTLNISASIGAQWRSDSVRPLDTNTLELKVGEIATDFGDYILPAGNHTADLELVVETPTLSNLREDTPQPIRRMLERHTLTALPFRGDTATYSNNGASIHCTTSLADVSAIAEQLDSTVDLPAMEWVGRSLQRWLDGAPSYGSGTTSHGDHRLDDEYVHMSANTLSAAARFAASESASNWFRRNRKELIREIEGMLARDVDGDGLVESTLRVGNSGDHQWSTCWADVLSFGWKDAWANAVLFEAWSLWVPVLEEQGENDLAGRVNESRNKLQSNYFNVFFNPETGIIAGWRSQDGELHDYGFSQLNGMACMTELLKIDQARGVMESLVAAWASIGLHDFRNGIPLNIWRIPEYDIGGVIFGLPMGSYQQGGYSHHGARVIVDALERVGLTEKSAQVLEELAITIADDTSFGGLGSGIDWRMKDGTPSGYEGQLVEGFSILASALSRYRVTI
jgi:hypothetical protein